MLSDSRPREGLAPPRWAGLVTAKTIGFVDNDDSVVVELSLKNNEDFPEEVMDAAKEIE